MFTPAKVIALKDIEVREVDFPGLGKQFRASVLVRCDVQLSELALTLYQHNEHATKLAQAKAKHGVWQKLYGELYHELRKLRVVVRANLRPDANYEKVDQLFTTLYDLLRPPS